MQLLISDTNILIDMEEGGLLTELFSLPYQLCVPDILYYEELEEQHARLLDLGLSLLLAKQEIYPLVSGDKDLRAAAKSEDVVVRGTLWLVE